MDFAKDIAFFACIKAFFFQVDFRILRRDFEVFFLGTAILKNK